jgi:hypothetical protein
MMRTTRFSMSNSDLPQEFEGEVEEDERADSNGEERYVWHSVSLPSELVLCIC